MIATDGCFSFALFNYNGSIGWTAENQSRHVIGASGGNGLIALRSAAEVVGARAVRDYIGLASNCTRERNNLRQCVTSTRALRASRRGICWDSMLVAILDSRYSLYLVQGRRRCFINRWGRVGGANVVSIPCKLVAIAKCCI